jgi:branched-chain amino acid transport system substrate-binding protein
MLGSRRSAPPRPKFGEKPLTGEQVRWGFENLDITEERIEAARLPGSRPIKISCPTTRARPGVVQQWDGSKWEDHLRLDRAATR